MPELPKFNRFIIVQTADLPKIQALADKAQIPYAAGKFDHNFSFLRYQGAILPHVPDSFSHAIKAEKIGFHGAIGNPTESLAAKRIARDLKGMAHKFPNVTAHTVDRFTVIQNAQLHEAQRLARRMDIPHTTVVIDADHTALRYKGSPGPASRDDLALALSNSGIRQLAGTGNPAHVENLERARQGQTFRRIAETEPEARRDGAKRAIKPMDGALRIIDATRGERRALLERLGGSAARMVPFVAPIIAATTAFFRTGDAKAALIAATPGAQEELAGQRAEATAARMAARFGALSEAPWEATRMINDTLKATGREHSKVLNPSNSADIITAAVAISTVTMDALRKGLDPKSKPESPKPAAAPDWPSPPISR